MAASRTEEVLQLMENIGWTGLMNTPAKRVILEYVQTDPGFADRLISKAIFHANGWHRSGREEYLKWRQASSWGLTCYRNERSLRGLAQDIAQAKKAALIEKSEAA